jgi:hypothetical protein
MLFNFDDVILNKDNLDMRIKFLLNLYKRENNMNLRLGIFYELMGYSKYSIFHDILFKFFNENSIIY